MDDKQLKNHRDAWQHRGQHRPDFAVEPQAGQESVWDYPRPPIYVVDERSVVVRVGGTVLAESNKSIRALETGSPPAFYLPADAFNWAALTPSRRETFCEWKGVASYFDVLTPDGVIEAGVWTYKTPLPDAEAIAGWCSCYPEQLQCEVAGEPVQAQAGRYYGGWVTSELVGPWKGEPGTGHW
jgi:uncharacterized protein (DUF427 family)